MQLTGSWLRSIVWFYSGKNVSIKSILFLLFISDLAMVTYITEVFKTFWWQASVFWFKKAVEKLAISHEKLQKWNGREGKFPMREDEFMKISDQRIILIGKGNILYTRIFFIRKYFIRKLGWEKHKNKKYFQKMARLTFKI